MKTTPGRIIARIHPGIILFLLMQSFAYGVHAQMRQVYVDSPANDLKKISFYTPSSGYVAFTKWIGYTTDSGRSFTKKYITIGNVNYNGYNVNLTFGFGITGVKAFNANSIVVYGNYGLVPAILNSADGGNTFTLVYQSQLNSQQYTNGIMDMIFPKNDGIGYAVEADRIIKSTDGGKSWFAVLNDPNAFYNHLSAPDDNNLFACSDTKLMKSADGGASWQQVTIPGKNVNYAYFLTPSEGWINIADDGNLGMYYSPDGGTTWTEKNNPGITPFNSTFFQFINDSVGYSVSGYTVLKTMDSGRVWQPLPRDNSYTYLNYALTDLFFLNPNQFWAGGGNGFLEITTNGGGTPIPQAIFSIDASKYQATGLVYLNNYSQAGYQYKWYVNGSLLGTTYNISYTHNAQKQADSIKLIVSDGITPDTALQVQYFAAPNLPTVTGFSPSGGSKGSQISISGSGLSHLTAVTFGGVPADSFRILSDALIEAFPGNGNTGSVSVTDIHGTNSLPGFTYFPPPSSPPPVISSMSPAAGPIGSTVVLSGNNFDPLSSNNVVYFGATRALVQAASPTQITCQVPAGASYEPLSVLNKRSGLSGTSLKPFATVFGDSSNFTPSSFSQALHLTLPNNFLVSKYLMGKDLDGDGKTDILGVFAAYGSDSVVVFHNSTNNRVLSFDPYKSLLPVAANGPGNFDMGDLDGDGLPDITAATNGQYLYISRNTGTPGNIRFSPWMGMAISGSSYRMGIADMDNDGRNDIVVGTYGGVNGLVVIRNTSSPGVLSFADPRIYNTPDGNVYAMAIGDLDGDGKKDIVVNSNAGLCCFRNTGSPGNISFAPMTIINGYALDIRFADMDGDGKLDLVVTNRDQLYCIYLNTSTPGNISFAQPVIYPITQSIGTALAIADLNGDEKPDFLGAGATYGVVNVLRNVSTPGVVALDGLSNYGSGQPYQLNTGDVDGDGKTDLIIGDTPGGSGVTILKNNMNAAAISSTCENSDDLIQSNLSGTTYQWQQDSGSGFSNIGDNTVFSGTATQNLTIKSIPLSWNGYRYRCFVDGTNYSGIYILQVNSLARPTVNILNADTVICSGSTASFTATSVNAQTPSYTWQINGQPQPVQGSVFSTAVLKDGDLVNVVVSSTDQCGHVLLDTSRTVKITVNALVTPTVTISHQPDPVCSGMPVSFSAVSADTGLVTAYQWVKNGLAVGGNSNIYVDNKLVNGDVVFVTLSTAPPCATTTKVQSNQVSVSVTTIPVPTITITGSTTVAAGQSSLVSSGVTNMNGSSSLQWQDSTGADGWKNVPGATKDTLRYIPAKTGDDLRCLIKETLTACGNEVLTDSSNILSFVVNGGTSADSGSLVIHTFPNPVHSILYLDSLQASAQWQSFEIVSVSSGAKLLTGNAGGKIVLAIPVESLPAGLYVIVLRSRSGSSWHFKFAKL